jgi:hypothetical protein
MTPAAYEKSSNKAKKITSRWWRTRLFRRTAWGFMSLGGSDENNTFSFSLK